MIHLILLLIIILPFTYLSTISLLAGDFIQFQSAHLAFISGLNPYESDIMLNIQQNISADPTQNQVALMMWTLPWILTLLCPFGFSSNLEESLFQWCIWGAFLTCVSMIALFKDTKYSFFSKKSQLLVLVTICLSAPLLDAFKLHQSTPVFLLSLSLFYVAIKRRYYFCSGICMSIWVIKPHLFLLIILSLLTNQKKIKPTTKLALGVFFGAGILLAISELKYPGGTKMWLDTLQFAESSSGDTVARISWKGTNLFGLLRDNFYSVHPLILLIPTIVTLVTFIYLKLRAKLISDNITNLAWLIPTAIFIAPYGWFYDYSLCIVSTYLTLRIASYKNRLSLILLITIMFNLFTGFYYLYIAKMQHNMWWYPIGCILIYTLASCPMERSKRFATKYYNGCR